jgi:hypothetical protein
MLGFGLAQRAATAGTLAARVAGNQLLQRTVDTGIDGLGKIAENAISGKAWHTELPETLLGNFVLGSAADGIVKLGKHLATSAWSKHGDSVISGINRLDRLAGSVLDWSKNPVSILQPTVSSGFFDNLGLSRIVINGLDDTTDPFSKPFMAMINDAGGLIGKALSDREELLHKILKGGNKPLDELGYSRLDDELLQMMKERNITLEKIDYLSSDLSQATKQYRLDNPHVSMGKNVAAVKFINQEGIEEIFIRHSARQHSEMEILTSPDFLSKIGGEAKNISARVKELYTEFQP